MTGVITLNFKKTPKFQILAKTYCSWPSQWSGPWRAIYTVWYVQPSFSINGQYRPGHHTYTVIPKFLCVYAKKALDNSENLNILMIIRHSMTPPHHLSDITKVTKNTRIFLLKSSILRHFGQATLQLYQMDLFIRIINNNCPLFKINDLIQNREIQAINWEIIVTTIAQNL